MAEGWKVIPEFKPDKLTDREIFELIKQTKRQLTEIAEDMIRDYCESRKKNAEGEPPHENRDSAVSQQ